MLPYLAQGANSSIEDGAVLGGILARLNTKDQLPQALSMFQSLRKQRGESIVRETFKQVSRTSLVKNAWPRKLMSDTAAPGFPHE
jgi:2-polyprenyl-6-methoxyphenol hydroxylase-like FAD-dependent oxidoreductase